MINSTKNIKEMIDYSKDGIISKVIEKDELSDITLFSMSQNTKISTHTSTKSGIIYVIEGEGTFKLEDQKIKMTPGVMIFMQANAKHSISAKENTSFILILRKTQNETN